VSVVIIPNGRLGIEVHDYDLLSEKVMIMSKGILLMDKFGVEDKSNGKKTGK
jgi:hypothetical protein